MSPTPIAMSVGQTRHPDRRSQIWIRKLNRKRRPHQCFPDPVQHSDPEPPFTAPGPEHITPSLANTGPRHCDRIQRGGSHLHRNQRGGTSSTGHASYHVPPYVSMSEFEDDDAQEEVEEETFVPPNPTNVPTQATDR